MIKLKGKSQARKVRWDLLLRGKSFKSILSYASTSFAILATVFHMMSMRDGYSNNNTHRTFRDWLLPFILVMGQP